MCHHPGGIHIPRALGKTDRGTHTACPGSEGGVGWESSLHSLWRCAAVIALWRSVLWGRREGVRFWSKGWGVPTADLLPQSSSIIVLPSSFSSFPAIFLCERLDGTNQEP